MASFSAFAPASLSNLGPGFDSLGVALEGWGDQVTIDLDKEPGFSVIYDANSVWAGTTDPLRNTASVSAMHVAQLAGYRHGARLCVKKGIRAGSGLGSSAASAVAGALAMNAALGSPFSKAELLQSCLAGEATVSGAIHGDNVVPCLIGGIVLVDADDPTDFLSIVSPENLHFAIILPEIEVFTQQARSLLPDQITLHEGAVWASNLARLAVAITNGDIERIGRLIMRDEIVEPIRAGLIEPYRDIKWSAIKAGALGCALSGSGPAMFAVCDTAESAAFVAQAMQKACTDHAVHCLSVSSRVNMHGAYVGQRHV